MTAGEELATKDYSRWTRSCDIVMKGGITSGVVYPHAVCALAETYRFRNVGGTSAGAIAAAASAAAEYGRESKKGGFGKLATLPDWIETGKNLQNLFQPQPSTKRLFAVMIAKIDRGWPRMLLVAVARHLPAFALGAVPGLAFAALALLSGLDSGFGALQVVALALGGLIAIGGGALGVVLRLARQLTRAVPDNGFGICSGGPGAGPGDAPALTPWLAGLIDETAGLPPGEPLTFGHLWAGPGKERIAAAGRPEDPYLDLAMMTTNLTNRRAHKLPWDSREWFFEPAEFRRLFPKEVVDWMVARPQASPPPGTVGAQESRLRRALFPDLVPLPEPSDLPVVVAARMSLSFPVLLSAVPLWNLDMSCPKNKAALAEWRRWARTNGDDWDPLKGEISAWPRPETQPKSKPKAEPCWFSDGGISSNFPVHFFDRLVPRWPTFAINLRPFPSGKEPDLHDQSNNTEMAKSNSDGIAEWWYRLPRRPRGLGLIDTRIFQFLSSAVRTMQNRADEAQMRAPGYRDRVAHVNMSKTEGGMNLTMEKEVIAALTARGRVAAEGLRDAYTPPDEDGQKLTWSNHRWARFRYSLAVLEQLHGHFADGYAKPPEVGDETPYAELLEPGPPPSYDWERQAQARLAREQVAAILALAELSDSENTVAEGSPKPVPEVRIKPRD